MRKERKITDVLWYALDMQSGFGELNGTVAGHDYRNDRV
jgi:hypothetical protein